MPTTSEQKRAYWSAMIGKRIAARNHRDFEAVGTLLSVCAGVWGYGGDSVALVLDVKDDRGLREWPAALCSVIEQN